MDRYARILEVIQSYWSWTGSNPVEVLAVSPWGNVVFRSKSGALWRICPEEYTCEEIAVGDVSFSDLMKMQSFREDWHLEGLRQEAEAALGLPASGHCYYVAVSPVIGGEYTVSNVAIILTSALLIASGQLAKQFRESPGGAKISEIHVDGEVVPAIANE